MERCRRAAQGDRPQGRGGPSMGIFSRGAMAEAMALRATMRAVRYRPEVSLKHELPASVRPASEGALATASQAATFSETVGACINLAFAGTLAGGRGDAWEGASIFCFAVLPAVRAVVEVDRAVVVHIEDHCDRVKQTGFDRKAAAVGGLCRPCRQGVF